MDGIVDQMERLPVVSSCYEAWWTLQCQVDDYYAERERQRPPLSKRKEFRQIKNAVIREAENIRLSVFTFEDEGIATEDEPEETAGISYDFGALRDVVQSDDLPMAERDESVARLQRLAEDGEAHTQYLMGKLCLIGQGVSYDKEQAVYWLTQAENQGNQYAQFFLDRQDSLRPPSVMLAATRLLHHMGKIFQEQFPAPVIPGGIQMDRKLRRRIQEKKIALGHKPDDHEEQEQGDWNMTMG